MGWQWKRWKLKIVQRRKKKPSPREREAPLETVSPEVLRFLPSPSPSPENGRGK